MPWARAVINGGLGAALIDYWGLTPIEHEALARASNHEKTTAELHAEEVENQKQMAAALTAAFGPPKKPTA